MTIQRKSYKIITSRHIHDHKYCVAPETLSSCIEILLLSKKTIAFEFNSPKMCACYHIGQFRLNYFD